MNSTIVPAGYSPRLDSYEIQLAIEFVKHTFQKEITRALNLHRVSAPLFVTAASGINDNLSGTERPVTFDIPAIGADAEIVHSLAKWKRVALKKYGFAMLEGLITDMNAVRRDEELDNLHSVYVDQWDWEKIIGEEHRTKEFLKETVCAIVNAICNTNDKLKEHFPALTADLSREVSFITSQQLEDLYPHLSPEERECEYVREHRTTFIMEIGDTLRSGAVHSKRAPDYDDWTLNGDILFWDDTLCRPIEISSMGIRVDDRALDEQLNKTGCNDRRERTYHKMLFAGELPLTIGGGIGQSRLCMLMLGCAHIGEVQSSLWDEQTVAICRENGIPLL